MNVSHKITRPGYYITRDGRKAIVLGGNPENKTYPWVGYVIGMTSYSLWQYDGFINGWTQEQHKSDIVDIWKEPQS